MSKIEQLSEQKIVEAEKDLIDKDYRVYDDISPFENYRDFMNALIRYGHPMHNIAMVIRNNRMKIREERALYRSLQNEHYESLKLEQ